MKFYAEKESSGMSDALKKLLAKMRAHRHFDAQQYVNAKIIVVNDYFRASHLSSALVAVSGGIDSAVVLSLITAASKTSDSPIKNIVPVTLPVFKSTYTTNQDEATSRAKEVIRENGLEPITYDLTKAYEALKKTIDEAYGVVGEPWASGQLVSYLRTPALYYTTSLLTQQEKSGLLCGTTNRDEGAYLGFVGKASDGIVDIQVISDLHKSEVRNVAKFLHVPKSILAAVPTGDMYDGRVDEEVFGTSYDFVELFLLLKSIDDEKWRNTLLSSLDVASKKQYDRLATKLEDLHRYNGHKYAVGSPAVHLDVMESGVPGGWTYGREKVDALFGKETSSAKPFAFSKNAPPVFHRDVEIPAPERIETDHGLILRFDELLREKEITFLLDEALHHNSKRTDKKRASVFSTDLAHVLWERISPHLEHPRIFPEESSTDMDASRVWRPIGVSPLFQFVHDDSPASSVPHDDLPKIISHQQRPLMNMEICLKKDGATRINDEDSFPVEFQAGSGICFDRRLLQDVSEKTGSRNNMIILADIVFARCGI